MTSAQGISIVIPHHGDPHPTLSLIEQLRAQVPLDQLIVVDDASPTPFPETAGVTVVRRPVNGGFGSAVNSGAEAASGDLMLVLNSDLQVSDDFVEQMLQAHLRFPDAVLSPRVVDHDGQQTWVGRDFPKIHHQVVEWLTPLARWRHTLAWHRAVGHDIRAVGKDMAVDWVMGAAMLIPLAAFREVGGFDERFFMNCEEIDLQLRLRGLGVSSVALSSPTVSHVGGGSSPSSIRRQWLVTSRFQYAEKWGGHRRLRFSLMTATAVNLAANTARRAVGRDLRPVATAREELGYMLPRFRMRH